MRPGYEITETMKCFMSSWIINKACLPNVSHHGLEMNVTKATAQCNRLVTLFQTTLNTARGIDVDNDLTRFRSGLPPKARGGVCILGDVGVLRTESRRDSILEKLSASLFFAPFHRFTSGAMRNAMNGRTENTTRHVSPIRVFLDS